MMSKDNTDHVGQVGTWPRWSFWLSLRPLSGAMTLSWSTPKNSLKPQKVSCENLLDALLVCSQDTIDMFASVVLLSTVVLLGDVDVSRAVDVVRFYTSFTPPPLLQLSEMPLYRVFAGAPSVHDVLDELNYGPTSHSKHNWTVHSVDLGEPQEARIVIPETQPATPQRISRLTMHPAERQRLDNQASLLIENDDSMISGDSGDLDVILPEATFIEASNRLTMLCNGLEFGDDEADEDGMERLIEDSRGK